MKHSVFSRILSVFLSLILLLGMVVPLAVVNAADSQTADIEGVVPGETWRSASSGNWFIQVKLKEALTGFASDTVLTGLTASFDGGEEQSMSITVVSDTLLNLIINLPAEVEGKLLTFQGTAKNADKEIVFEKPVTLLGTADNWVFQNITTVSVASINTLDTWRTAGGTWQIFVNLNESLDMAADTVLTGMTATFDGGEAQGVTVVVMSAKSLCLSVSGLPDLAGVAGKTLTFSGTAANGDKKIAFAEPVTLVGPTDGIVGNWTVQEESEIPVPDSATKITLASVNTLDTWRTAGGTWQIFVNLNESLDIATDTVLSGMAASFDGSAAQPVTVVVMSANSLCLSISGLPDLAGVAGKTLTISGTAESGDQKIAFAEPVTLVGPTDGIVGNWTVQEAGETPDPVTKITLASVNTLDTWRTGGGTWQIFVNLNESLEIAADTVMSGMTASFDGGAAQPFTVVVMSANSLCLSISGLPDLAGVAGKTLTFSGTAESGDQKIAFAEPVTLVGPTDGIVGNWTVQEEGETPDPVVTVAVDSVNQGETWRSSGSGNWFIQVNLNKALEGYAPDTVLAGLTGSFDGGAEQAVSVTVVSANVINLIVNLPAEVNGKTLTIQGTAVNGEQKFTLEAVTLVGTADNWMIQEAGETPDPDPVTKITLASVNTLDTWRTAGGTWQIFVNLNESLEIAADTVLSGMTASFDGGEAQPFTVIVMSAKSLCLSVSGLPDLAGVAGKTLTISGTAESGDQKIAFAEPVTLVGPTDGIVGNWNVQATVAPPDFSNAVALEGIIADETWRSAASGNWFIQVQLAEALEGFAPDTVLSGLTGSFDGGAAQAITVTVVSANRLNLIVNLPAEVNGKTLTIQGKAVKGEQEINFGSVTLVGTATGWALQGTSQTPETTLTVTVDAIVPGECWRSDASGNWFIQLKLKEALEGFAPDTVLSGLTGSFDGGAAQAITVTVVSANRINLIVNLPAEVEGKVLTFQGTAASGNKGITFAEPVSIVGSYEGWSIGTVAPTVTFYDGSAKSLNYATRYIGTSWYIYLNMNGNLSKLPYDLTLSGFEYSINDGPKKKLSPCSWQAHEGGTLWFALSEIPEKITENAIITISGKARTSTGVGINLTKDIVLYANQYGIELGQYKKAPVYTDIKVTGVNYATNYFDAANVWHVYLETDKKLPGEVDRFFDGMILEVNGVAHEIRVQHAFHEGTLWFTIDKAWMSKNAPNGASVTLKAGKGVQQAAGVGINLLQDVTLYKFFEFLTLEKPTTDTQFTDVTFSGMAGAIGYVGSWYFDLVPYQKLPGGQGDKFYYLDVELNGEPMQLVGSIDTGHLIFTIPGSVLPQNTETATLTLKAGTEAVGGHGEIGIRVKEDVTVYLFNGKWSDEQFTEIKEVELACNRLYNFLDQESKAHLYFQVKGEFPGRAWYNSFSLPVDIDGKTVNVQMYKGDSAAGKILYIGLPKKDVKDGTLVTLKAGATAESGGYRIIIKDDFQIIYTNGMWLQNRQTDIEAPEAQNLWNIARFEPGYIPVSTDGYVMMSGEKEFNKILSTERLMDFTVAFSAEKLYNDATSSPFSLVLRGTPISEDDPMSLSVLNGYVITFEGYECSEATHPNNPDIWGTKACYIYIWKNGVNAALMDQYCIGTYHNTNDNPYFKYDEAYNYEVSVYNVSDTAVCIELRVNGKLVYKCYDEAGADPADPAVNPGVFGIFGVAPTLYGGETVELEAVIAAKTECFVQEEVTLAVTYPSNVTGAEFTVDKKGARVENGVFFATEPGVYTVSATYNGKDMKSVTITVKEHVIEDNGEISDESNEPSTSATIWIIASAIVAVLAVAGVIAAVAIKQRKKTANPKK